jgi:hypothetical protein
VRELLKRGLVSECFDVSDDGAHSKDFGIGSDTE